MLSDRELSALVGEKVMGLSVCRDENCAGCDSDIAISGTWSYIGKEFATDPGLALEAAVTLDDSLDCFSIEIHPNVATGKHRAELSWYDQDHWDRAVATSISIARALCLAALRAVGVECEDDITELSAHRSDRAMDERGEAR